MFKTSILFFFIPWKVYQELATTYLKVKALATGSFEWRTVETRLTNSSTFVILSKCLSLCWTTRNTHSFIKFELWRNMSASFSNALLISIGNGYFANKRGNFTMASLCSPNRPQRRPWSNSANAAFASPKRNGQY